MCGQVARPAASRSAGRRRCRPNEPLGGRDAIVAGRGAVAARASGSAAGGRAQRPPAWRRHAVAPRRSRGRPKDDYFTLDELRGEMKKLAWTKGDFSIVPYGYLWGNTVYSTERTSPAPTRCSCCRPAHRAAEQRVHRGRAEHPARVRRGRPAGPVFRLRQGRRQGGNRLPEQRARTCFGREQVDRHAAARLCSR